MTIRAFTLIETLATVVLLAMIAAAGAIGLTGASETARWQEAAAIIRATDNDARSLSLTAGVVTLSLNQDQDSMLVHAGGDLVLERAIPIRVHLVDADTEDTLSQVLFDPDGRSQDYFIVLEDGERIERVRICGLTGWATP